MATTSAGGVPTSAAPVPQQSPTTTNPPPTTSTQPPPPSITTTTTAPPPPATSAPPTTIAPPPTATTVAPLPTQDVAQPTNGVPTVIPPLVTDPVTTTLRTRTTSFTPTATSSTTVDAQSGSAKNTGAIIGGVVGALFFAGVIGLCFFAMFRRRQRSKSLKPELPWGSENPIRPTSPQTSSSRNSAPMMGMSYATPGYPFTSDSYENIPRAGSAYGAGSSFNPSPYGSAVDVGGYNAYPQNNVQSGWVQPPAPNTFTMRPYGQYDQYGNNSGVDAPMGTQPPISTSPPPTAQQYFDGGILAPTEYYGQQDSRSDPLAAMGFDVAKDGAANGRVTARPY